MLRNDKAELYPQMTPPPARRAAVAGDCADLAVRADMATRRMTSYLWGLAAQPGQSAFEVGRRIIHSETGHFSHFRNWRVAGVGRFIAGALCGSIMATPPAIAPPRPEVAEPLNALKLLAVGTWYLSALALYPEQQRKGHGCGHRGFQPARASVPRSA